jgi:hypothetical protein
MSSGDKKEQGRAFGGLVLLAIVALFWYASTKPSGSEAPAAAAATAPSQPRPFVVHRGSFCEAFPTLGKLFVGFYVTNPGNATVEYDVTPIRQYSDGSTNQSAMDELILQIPPGTHSAQHTYAYQATDHALTRCGIQDDTTYRMTWIRVRPPKF